MSARNPLTTSRLSLAALMAAAFGLGSSVPLRGMPEVVLPTSGATPVDQSEKFGKERLDEAAERRLRRAEKKLRDQQRAQAGKY